MIDNNWLEKLATTVVSTMLANNKQSLTFNLDEVKLKLPWANEPLTLSGKLTIEFSASKKGKK